MSEETIVQFEKNGKITIACVTSASVLDALNVDQFGKEVLDHVRNNPNTNLLLDFQQVDYLSSAVLTELLRTRKAQSEVGGNVRLCSLNEDIRKVFEITNLDQIFVIEPDKETALTRYKRSLDVAEREQTWDEPKKET